MASAYLVEITAAVDDAGALQVFRFGSAAAFMTRPYESPPNAVYEPRVITAGNFESNLWARGTTRGRSEAAFGYIELSNADGALDAWLDYGFDGQTVTIRKGETGAAYPSGFPAIFSGYIRNVEVTFSTVRVNILDIAGLLSDKPLQETKYLGTNSGPSGVEGLPTDIRGNPKPRLFGAVSNISPPVVNTSTLIYQVDDGRAVLPMTLTVRHKGVVVTAGVARATLADLISNAPGATVYDYYAGAEGWYFRIGFAPSGQVTCTVSEGAAAQRTVAQLVSKLAVAGGISASSIEGASSLDALCPYEIGVWEFGETTYGTVIDTLLDSVNGYFVQRRDGSFKLGKLTDPASNLPVASYQGWQIKGGPESLRISPSSDPGVGIRVGLNGTGEHGYQVQYSSRQGQAVGLPVWRVLLDYDRNATVQTDTDVAGAAADWVAYSKDDYRTVIVEDSSIRAKHKYAPEFNIQTLIRTAANAATEAAIQLALRKVPRVVIEIPLDPEFASMVDRGDTFSVAIERFGWNSGKRFLCIGIIENTGQYNSPAVTTLIGWG